MCTEHPVHILAQEFQVQNSSNKATPQNIQATPFGVATHSLTNTGLDNLKFSLLSHFMTTMIVLPHSSAAVERIFSQINRMKTKSTSFLEPETVRNRVLAKQSITRKNQTYCCWEPNPKLITEMMDGTVMKRYQERLINQKYKDVSHSESDNEEETALIDD